MNEFKNYYEVLEINTWAKSDEIYQSYQRAKAAYSHDSLALYSLISADECRQILDLIEEAYSVLSDPQKRRRYDETRGINAEFNDKNYNQLSNRVAPIRDEIRKSMQEPSRPSPQPLTINEQNSQSVSKLVNQKRFSLDYILQTDFESEIENCKEFSGEFLRRIREYKNVDLERLADMTKVSKTYLQSIENEDFAKLPAPVYVRGFVFQYAKCLKLKTDEVANSYVARMKRFK